MTNYDRFETFDDIFPEEARRIALSNLPRKKDFSKFIVVLSILTILAYTVTALYFVWHEKFIPDSLTYSFYGVFGVELSALAGIKIKEAR